MKKRVLFATCLIVLAAFCAISFNKNSVNAIVKSNVEALVGGEEEYSNGEFEWKTYTVYKPGDGSYFPDGFINYDVLFGENFCDELDYYSSPIGTCIALHWLDD